MCVIDDDRPTLRAFGDELHAARNGGQVGESRGGGCRRTASRNHQPERGEGVHRLEFADERQHQLVPLPYYLKDEDLAAGSRFARDQPEIGAWIGAIGEHRMSAIAAQRRQALELAAVAIEDSRPARRQEGKQAFLCRPVVGYIAMVIQMVACQVGIRRRGDGQTVEPKLVESVARSLDSHMLDPLSCKLGQIAVQGYRVGRSQGSGAMRGGGNQTERAEACCRMAERRPDFACEVDDRGLAVGAGDGGDYPGLSAAESCRQQRQAARWICVDY